MIIAIAFAVLVIVGVIAAVASTKTRRQRELDKGHPATVVTQTHLITGSLEELDAGRDSFEETESQSQADSSHAVSYREGLGRSRGLFEKLRARVGRATIDQTDLDDLEEALIRADVGTATTARILAAVVAAKRAGSEVDLLDLVRGELLSMLSTRSDGTHIDRDLQLRAQEGRVPVWLFVGVNGVGKTTTIGKIATAKGAEGERIVLAAGDTFRAAAGEQLELWGERSGADVIRGAEGADPSAVIFDAIQRGKAKGASLVLADTAGRLHNKVNLVEELKKIRRVADREPGEVCETLLVLDATTGQNGLVQAREFLDATGVSGVVLTKLDGSAKGGVIVAIEAELAIPVKLVGLGESAADLVAFDPEAFVDALLNR